MLQVLCTAKVFSSSAARLDKAVHQQTVWTAILSHQRYLPIMAAVTHK